MEGDGKVRRNALAAVQLNPTTNSEINLSRGNVGRHSVVTVVCSACNNARRCLRGGGGLLVNDFVRIPHPRLPNEKKRRGRRKGEKACRQKSFYLTIPLPVLINVHVSFLLGFERNDAGGGKELINK